MFSWFKKATPATEVATQLVALVLSYGAYVAEVYRSGLEGVHWSQTAAARTSEVSGE